MDRRGGAGAGSEAGREPWERPQHRAVGEQRGPDKRCSGRSIYWVSNCEALGNSSVLKSPVCEMGVAGGVP